MAIERSWDLFGYDMRNVRGLLVSAWRDLLWGESSPIRRRLDDSVRLESERGSICYQGGEPSDAAATHCAAIMLPEQLVLARVVVLPLAVEADLQAALGFEVTASSPFATDDTAYGWRVVGRDETRLRVALVLVSRSAVMTYLANQYSIHDPLAREVWAEVDGRVVVVNGFGEVVRQRRYRGRLRRSGLLLGASALLLLAIIAVAAVGKRVELERLVSMSEQVERDAASAAQLRNTLAAANEGVAALQSVALQFPNPHFEIARLTELLDDTVSVERFSMNGLQIDLRGRAADAAAVMAQLTDQADYAEVTAPRAISRVAGTEREQFYLTIRLRGSPPE
ncbi:MAG: PilN domain-containing protein [Pseudomonadota bacterium]